MNSSRTATPCCDAGATGCAIGGDDGNRTRVASLEERPSCIAAANRREPIRPPRRCPSPYFRASKRAAVAHVGSARSGVVERGWRGSRRGRTPFGRLAVGARHPERTSLPTYAVAMPPVTEEELRDFVRVAVADDGSDGQTAPLIVDEFVVGTEGRIDLALVGDALIGYELKSDLDTLRRLPQQMSSYSKVFDFCTLVVTDRHLGGARRALDPRWGLAVVRREAGKLTYKQIRKARPLRRTDAVALAGLLWRDEALHALDLLGAAAGLRSKPRDVLWERLAQVASQDELRAIVVRALTARQGWRDVQAPREYDETFQYAGASSRFLARRFRPQCR